MESWETIYAKGPLPGRGPSGLLVWPIEEFLARTKHRRDVAERIARLNPNGKEEGATPRGLHWHERSPGWWMGCVRVSEFIERFGRDAYRALPNKAFLRRGKRKAIHQGAIHELGLVF